MTKRFSLTIGILAFVAGVFAFIPNALVGTNALFASNAMTGVIDIILGIIFIYVAYKEDGAIAKFYKVIGIIAVVAAAICFLLAGSAGAGSLLGISFNNADSWLVLIVGITLITLAEKISAKIKLATPAKK